MVHGILIGAGIGIIVTLVYIVLIAWLDSSGDHSWIPKVIIAGTVITIILSFLWGRVGYEDDKKDKIDSIVKDTLATNYGEVTNYHNDYDNKSFVADNSKYTFDYDEETKILTVFSDTESSVDAVFIDGVKQTDTKTSNSGVQKKDCVSYQTSDDETDADNSSSTTSSTVELQQKIQDKIQSRYNGAVLTSFDTVNLSGTFACDDLQYSFSWKDDMLEIMNTDDQDDVTYYKIVEK